MTVFRRKRVLQSGGILLVLVLVLFTGLASVPKAYAEGITVSSVNISATVGVPFSGEVATVSDPAATDPSQLPASIDWGDGTTTAGTVSGSGGSFVVTGTHTYTAAGTFTFTVSVTDTSTGVTATGTGTASVAPLVIQVSPQNISATVGVPFSGEVATVSDPAATDPSQLPASIDWGDGTTTAGTVSGSGGSFVVTGTHTYTAAGTFTFTVSVIDLTYGVTATGTGTASVHDVTAPTLSLPGSITKDATSPQGVVVTYTVTATDPDNPPSQLKISCSPVSGSTFPIGTTTVNCTASDPAGNTASGSFQVVVQGAAQQTSDLISLVNSFHLSKSLQTALDNKLRDVLVAITAGQTATACSDLTDFIGFVQSHTGKGLSTSQAQQLIAAAQQIQAVLGC